MQQVAITHHSLLANLQSPPMVSPNLSELAAGWYLSLQMPSSRCPNFTCFTFNIAGCGHNCIITRSFSANQQSLENDSDKGQSQYKHTFTLRPSYRRKVLSWCNESFISEFTKVQNQQGQSLTKSCYFCFLCIPPRSCFIWPYATSTLAHLALLVTFSIHMIFPDTLLLFACLLFTICPWGIIIRMCMCSRPHCCHWTAYKGLWTGYFFRSML